LVSLQHDDLRRAIKGSLDTERRDVEADLGGAFLGDEMDEHGGSRGNRERSGQAARGRGEGAGGDDGGLAGAQRSRSAARFVDLEDGRTGVGDGKTRFARLDRRWMLHWGLALWGGVRECGRFADGFVCHKQIIKVSRHYMSAQAKASEAGA